MVNIHYSGGMSGDKKPKKKKKLKKDFYEEELKSLQLELVKMQEWVKAKGEKIVVIFEGRDASGKGGVIRRITETLNPRVVKVVALGKPTEREESQWYFQRYVPHLPAAGEMCLFDRSWYNAAGVDRVMGFLTPEQVDEFLLSCPEFEKMLLRSGIRLIKFWFSVSSEEQDRRFQERIDNPLKQWKFSPMDLKSRERWEDYSEAKDKMMAATDTEESPWWIVEGDDKRRARLNTISQLLNLIPYEEIPKEEFSLPPRPKAKGYNRPPKKQRHYVPELY